MPRTTRLSPGHASVTQLRSTNKNTQLEGKITVMTLSFIINKHSGGNFIVFSVLLELPGEKITKGE